MEGISPSGVRPTATNHSVPAFVCVSFGAPCPLCHPKTFQVPQMSACCDFCGGLFLTQPGDKSSLDCSPITSVLVLTQAAPLTHPHVQLSSFGCSAFPIDPQIHLSPDSSSLQLSLEQQQCISHPSAEFTRGESSELPAPENFPGCSRAIPAPE